MVSSVLVAVALVLTGAAPNPGDPVTDWAATARYTAANQALIASGARPDIVFIGDSITESWFAPERGFHTAAQIGRGISGQTSSQILVRFRRDVVALRPRLVHIMIGTNDIAGNTGPISDADVAGNIASMAELAQAHGIGVILGSIPPADKFPWRPGLAVTPRIIALNARLRDYAARCGFTYADYWTVLATPEGAMREGLSTDHVHPTAAGYSAMRAVAEKAIPAADRGRAHHISSRVCVADGTAKIVAGGAG